MLFFFKCLHWEITCMPSHWQQSDSNRQCKVSFQELTSNIILSQICSQSFYGWRLSNRPQGSFFLFAQLPNRSLGQKQGISKLVKTVFLACKHFWVNLKKYKNSPISTNTVSRIMELTSKRIQYPHHKAICRRLVQVEC